jgi:hypothetical protein
MWRFLQSRAIGGPQFLAAALLLVYLLECLWLVRVQSNHGARPDSDQALRIEYGLQQWKGGPVAGTPESLRAEAATGVPSAARFGHLRVREGFDQDRSPLYYLIAGAPMLIRPASWTPNLPLWHLLAVTPYLFFGVMLGGSLWYVARRLYGNAGGYIALTLYCFSPAMILNVAGGQSLGEMGGVWGTFGAVWTGIAVAHTLYAPREVVLWNWRRILLLGLSVTLTVGNQFSLAVLVIVALLLMLWVARVRKGAVFAIWGAACAVAIVLLVSAYFFRLGLFSQGMANARWLDFNGHALAVWVSYRHIAEALFRGSPALILALPAAVVAFAAWKRTRYFGNAAPLGIAALLLILGMAAPNFPGEGFHLAALTFLFVFVAGVFADLMETRRGPLLMAAVSGLLVASAFWNILQLMQAR